MDGKHRPIHPAGYTRVDAYGPMPPNAEAVCSALPSGTQTIALTIGFSIESDGGTDNDGAVGQPYFKLTSG